MELTIEKFTELLDTYENSNCCSSIRVGDYEGSTFAIFDGWESVEGFSAFINGFEGLKGSKPYLSNGQSMHDKYLELKALSEANPEHYGYKRDREVALSHFLYAQYLASNNIDPISIDDFGVDWGFSDEYDTCCHCGNVLRISPDSYSWTPPLFVDCEGYACDNCCESGHFDDYVLEQYKNDNKSIPDSFDLERLGLVKVNSESFENGLYGGQLDEPAPIIEGLNNEGIDCWFKCYPGQFDVSFDVFVIAEQLNNAKAILSGVDTKAEIDPAVALERGLRAASQQMNSLSGDGIKHASTNSDGSCQVKLVSKEDFIKGIK